MSGGTDDIGGPFTATYDAEPAARTPAAAMPLRRPRSQNANVLTGSLATGK